MAEAGMKQPELPNIVSLVAERLHGTRLSEFLLTWETVIFSLIIISLLVIVSFIGTRRLKTVPGRLQGALELFVGGMDDFVCGILGPKGRRFTPFIGTLFIYILLMNLSGLIPLLKPSTTSWSVTLALALIVFVYLQYTGFKELGFAGFIDHLMGNPRGILAFSVVIPALMFFLHVVGELIRPISLSLRLRSNIWGDDMLLAVLAGFGVGAVPLLLFNMVLGMLAAMVQAGVFCLLTTIYFALVMPHEEH